MLTTRGVAAKAGISVITLERWIAAGRIKPKVIRRGGQTVRLWKPSDVERLKKLRLRKRKSGTARRHQRQSRP